jgi:hypothetical protein
MKATEYRALATPLGRVLRAAYRAAIHPGASRDDVAAALDAGGVTDAELRQRVLEQAAELIDDLRQRRPGQRESGRLHRGAAIPRADALALATLGALTPAATTEEMT